jgi:ribosomal protein S18 acetylase RimI-like enzyme
MRRAEAEALERGCRGVYVDTFHFQARGFYEKLGFAVFGTLEGMPAGGARYYLSKKLAP